MDRNGNGQIDDGTELFGNYTPGRADGSDITTANGFEALRYLQGTTYGFARPDTVIDQFDEGFGRLLLWRDLNHNGISEPGELQVRGGGGRDGDRARVQGEKARRSLR